MVLEEILAEIESKSGISRGEIQQRIGRKQELMSGLISLEGAAHLVAKDLGVELPDQQRRRLEIKNLVSGMKNVNIVGRVFRISNINDFSRKDGTPSRVVNLFIGDSTGYVKIALWNDQTSLVEDRTIKAGDAIHIVNGFSKENAFGDIELSLGKFGSIKPADDGAELPSQDEMDRRFSARGSKATTMGIPNIGPAEMDATIVDVFGGNFIFNVCPTCKSKLDDSTCKEHGKVQPEHAMVFSATADDGTGAMRIVMFRDVAEGLLGMKAAELASMERGDRLNSVKEKALGREIRLLGVVKKNNMSGNLELIVNGFDEIDARGKAALLIDRAESSLVGK
jgi:replication factor A1